MTPPNEIETLLPRYCENISTDASNRMDQVYRCVHCTCGGKLCLNRSMRILNFCHNTEREARMAGSFMLARVTHSLFQVVLNTREWGAEHLAVVDAHFHTIRDLIATDAKQAGADRPIGAALEDSVRPVEAWVEWLEQVGERLIQEHRSNFACLRQKTPAAHCSVAAVCGH